MTICYFGDFDPEYARNRVIIKGLRENGVQVLLCNDRSRGIIKFIALVKKYLALKTQYDIVIVGYSDSRLIVPLAKLITLRLFSGQVRKIVVWDAFYSIYDSWVFDRKIVKAGSLKAKLYWFLDWFNCKLANKILLDTNEHIKYFSQTFNITKSKFLKVLVGTDDKIFFPREKDQNNQTFVVHFHGKFIPLQGAEYIIRAADILRNEEVTFNIIGTGQEYNKIKNLAEGLKLVNIRWIDKVDYHELSEYIKNVDICLGIFGDTPKTQRVIPNKVYEAIAMKKPVISADTLAIRELLTDRENILLCKVADPDDLAHKILELKNSHDLWKNIAQGGYDIFRQHATTKIIGRQLMVELSKTFNL